MHIVYCCFNVIETNFFLNMFLSKSQRKFIHSDHSIQINIKSTSYAFIIIIFHDSVSKKITNMTKMSDLHRLRCSSPEDDCYTTQVSNLTSSIYRWPDDDANISTSKPLNNTNNNKHTNSIKSSCEIVTQTQIVQKTK